MKELNEQYSKHASRKFIFVMLSLFSAIILAYLDVISEAIYRDLIVALIAVYTTGNVWQKYIEKRANQ